MLCQDQRRCHAVLLGLSRRVRSSTTASLAPAWQADSFTAPSPGCSLETGPPPIWTAARHRHLCCRSARGSPSPSALCSQCVSDARHPRACLSSASAHPSQDCGTASAKGCKHHCSGIRLYPKGTFDPLQFSHHISWRKLPACMQGIIAGGSGGGSMGAANGGQTLLSLLQNRAADASAHRARPAAPQQQVPPRPCAGCVRAAFGTAPHRSFRTSYWRHIMTRLQLSNFAWACVSEYQSCAT